ncbi:hypothetical protein ACC734_38240, partial [Rhizobium ruizarguesonis]
QRTEQQSASVEETAASLEEITTTVRDAANRTEEASQLVARTRLGAEKSGEIVRWESWSAEERISLEPAPIARALAPTVCRVSLSFSTE